MTKLYIAENLKNLSKEIPSNVVLVAVSKTKSIAEIKEAYAEGQRDFGENKIQEMASKYLELPKDIRWHMIGHLQKNKIKYIAPFVYLIQGIDSFELLQEINKHAVKNNRVINCLLQVYIAQEDTKFGMTEEEIGNLLSNSLFDSLENIKIVGLMGIASFTDNEVQLRKEFNTLHKFYTDLKEKIHLPNIEFSILSMGMSGDFQLAIEEGSNMVRIGSAIFGQRNYI